MINWLTDILDSYLTYWLTGYFFGWLADGKYDWLVGSLVDHYILITRIQKTITFNDNEARLTLLVPILILRV